MCTSSRWTIFGTLSPQAIESVICSAIKNFAAGSLLSHPQRFCSCGTLQSEVKYGPLGMNFKRLLAPQLRTRQY